MAIAQYSPLNPNDVAQAYSVPLEGAVENLQQQQRLALDQQRYQHQLAMQQQQMALQRDQQELNFQKDLYDGIKGMGTPYYNYINDQLEKIKLSDAKAAAQNPNLSYSMRYAKLASPINNLRRMGEEAEMVSKYARDMRNQIEKQHPELSPAAVESQMLKLGFYDENGNLRSAPSREAAFSISNYLNNPEKAKELGLYDTVGLNKLSQEQLKTLFTPEDVSVDSRDAGGIVQYLGKKYPYETINPKTGAVEWDLQPINSQFGSYNGVNDAVFAKLNSNPSTRASILYEKDNLIRSNPQLAQLPSDQVDRIASASLLTRLGAPRGDVKPDRSLQRELTQQSQNAFNNAMSSRRLQLAENADARAAQRMLDKKQQEADINVFKDTITGNNRFGTTRQQQQQVFSKYQAPPPNEEMLQAFLKKYSGAPKLIQEYMGTLTKGNLKSGGEAKLAQDLVPINISGAFSNGKVANPFNAGQLGRAELWIDPTDQNKRAVIFLPSKTMKDKNDFVITVPDYDNMKVYEGNYAERFIDQLKDSNTEKGLQATEYTEE